MSETLLEIPRQNTPEWHRARAGKVTASNFCKLTRDRAGKGWGDQAKTYAFQLVGERLRLDDPDWKPPKPLSVYAIDYGNENEPFARASYIWLTSRNVAEYGFMDHPAVKNVGASLDGVVVDENGTIEIKCPETTKEHVRTMYTKAVPNKYRAQVQGGLWISGRDWCDFISFDNRIADHLTTCIVRSERDETYISELAAKVEEFAEYVDKIESEVRNERAA